MSKPIIEYIGSKLPPPMDPLAVVKKMAKTDYRNWHDKAELTAYVDSLEPGPAVDIYLWVTCGCGKEYEYVTKTDVPAGDVVCTCGKNIFKYQ
jgi:hypothetical protein